LLLSIDTIVRLRAICDDARRSGARVGVVPTMGYLHEGHRSLIRTARAQSDFVVVTIFVNPLQFGPNEDLDRYPRDLRADTALCAAEGVDVVFAPTAAEMYPRPPLTTVAVAGLTDAMCGLARPTHFDGVTTVVTKLFSIVGPGRAYFGRKDAQQLAVVRRMAEDLDLPVEVVGCPLVREPDGLAMSSRNAYLSPAQRQGALALSRSLRAAADAVVSGERRAATLRAIVTEIVTTEPMLELEYVDVRGAQDLTALDVLGTGEVLIALAARVGNTRLIDNVTVTIDGPTVSVDAGVVTAPKENV
jgi:pantoate--beta-alanine ligase